MALVGDEEIKRIRAVDQETLKTFMRKADTLKGQELDKLAKEYDEIRAKVQSLMDEKGDVLRSPMSKAELLEYAKGRLNTVQRDAISFLKGHLNACLLGHSMPFYELAMKDMFGEEKAYRLLWLFLQEKDIEPIVDSLEEVGLSAAERTVKIKQIDSEIAALTSKLNAAL
jgi:hypothetical protein